MKATLPVVLTLLLIGAVLVTPISSTAQTHEPTAQQTSAQNPDRNEMEADDPEADEDNDSSQDDEPVARVARITFIEGNVSFLRSGVTEWSDVAENLPLLTGDQIYVGSGGRVEIQFGRGNYVRLTEKTALTITELSQTAALLEVTEGTALIRLEKYGSAWERFEVDTPNSALVLKQDGLYRVNVRGEEDSELIIRKGLAEVFSDDGNFKLRDGQRLNIDSRSSGKLQIAIDHSNDEWDRWTYERDRQADYVAVSSAPDYVRQYENDHSSFYGASDLSNHGYWTNYSGYGNCWIPRVSAGWAPYRAGQWIWIPRAGWTWLSSEPWGWAPYHYGRWVYLNNIGWAWSPGFNNRFRYGHSYYQWRPALVAFFNSPSPRGNYIGWYPLAPGQRWRRSGNFGGDGFRGNNGHRHLQYPVAGNGTRNGDRRPNGNGNGRGWEGRPRLGNGVTVLPVEGFTGHGRNKFKPDVPNKDLSNSFGRGVRPGLPDLGTNANSFANTKVARLGDSANSLRPVVKPPQEVFTRPVVTRQRPSETQADVATPRQRRFIGAPGLKQPDNETHTKGGQRGETSSGNAQGGETKFERKQRMKNGDGAGGNVNNGDGNGGGRIITDDIVRRRVGRNEETPETRKGDGANNGDNSSNGKVRNRPTTENQPQGETDATVNKRERGNRNQDGSAAEGDANKRVYVPREKPKADAPTVEERRQEKQERRQQQEEQNQEQQRREEQERQQRRAERQQQEQQQQQEQERQQRRAERQQQEQQQEQERQQRRAERQRQEQQQQEQQRQQHEQRRAERQQQEQQQQRQQEQQQQQRREEKQQRKKGNN